MLDLKEVANVIMFKRFLVPVDFSEESRLSLKCAIQLAKKELTAKIYLLHVLPFVHAIDYPGPLIQDMKNITQRQEKKVQMDLDEWRREIPARFSSESIVKRGHAEVCIVKTCRERSIDLVVMTTHGRRGVKRLTHPNLSEKMARLAPCPVLILHLRRPDKKARIEKRRAA